jgi:hypothetical protein
MQGLFNTTVQQKRVNFGYLGTYYLVYYRVDCKYGGIYAYYYANILIFHSWRLKKSKQKFTYITP